MKFLQLSMLFFCLFLLGVSCSQNNEKKISSHAIQQPINPNGDSELALLMRSMFEEAQDIKKQILQEEPIQLNLDHQKILTAHATEPKKVASEEYQAFAASYLNIIHNLQTAKGTDKMELYDQLVANCMTCHQALCPGPMMKIKKLQ